MKRNAEYGLFYDVVIFEHPEIMQEDNNKESQIYYGIDV